MPKSLNTKGKVAIYHILEDEDLTLACEEAVQYAKQADFRENIAKQKLIKKAIFSILNDVDRVEEVYKIIEAHKEEY